MKTLLFCTSYAASPQHWQERYARWIAHYFAIPLEYDAMLLVDDCSPVKWPTADGSMVLLDETTPTTFDKDVPHIYSFDTRLGRQGMCIYPGWWRSFFKALDLATQYGFDKILHIESDAYVLSMDLARYLSTLESGWTTFWCPRWGFPETAIQVICRDQFDQMRDIGTKREEFYNQPVEQFFPFTHIERGFIGDRYSESKIDIAPNADYAVQVIPAQQVWFRASTI